MIKFIELTQETGGKVAINAISIANFSSLGGDSSRGSAISMNFSAGDKNSVRTIRVVEKYDEVRKLLMAKAGLSAA